jgi:hypothetical protein
VAIVGITWAVVVCMVLHAWIDFTTLGFSKAAADAKSPFTILVVLQYGAFLLALVGVFLVLRRGPTGDSDAAGAHAARSG